MSNEHNIENELGRQSREEAADDAMFDDAEAADIGPQSAAPSSPARVEAQARDARRSLDTPPDAPTPELLNKIEVTVGILEFEFMSYMQWVNKATSWFKNARLRGDKSLCVDAAGRVCLTGREFMRARDEGTFPIKVYRATF